VLWELPLRPSKLQHNRYDTNELESSAYPPYRLLRVTRPEQSNYDAEREKNEDRSNVWVTETDEFRYPPRRCWNPPAKPLQKL
jgi:hypothetical protein